jgi:hypothetical protein
MGVAAVAGAKHPRTSTKKRVSTKPFQIHRLGFHLLRHQRVPNFLIASAFISFGISSIAYRSAVRGMTALFRTT